MKHRPFAFSPVFAGMNREYGVTAGISIGLQAAIHLLRLQVGMFLVPLLDQTLIGIKKCLFEGLLYALTVDNSGDALLPHGKRLRNLPDRQAFHRAQMLHPAFEGFVLIARIVRHGGIITILRLEFESGLVSRRTKPGNTLIPRHYSAYSACISRGAAR